MTPEPQASDVLVFMHQQFSLSKIFTEQKLCDVKIICKPPHHTLRVHACVLSVASELLDTLFSSTDRNDAGEWEVEVPFELDVCRLLIESFYSGTLHCGPHVLASVIHLAMWLQVDKDMVTRLLAVLTERIDQMSRAVARPADARAVRQEQLFTFVCTEVGPAFKILSSFHGTLPATRQLGFALVDFLLRVPSARADLAASGCPVPNYTWLFLRFVEWNDQLREKTYDWVKMLGFVARSGGPGAAQEPDRERRALFELVAVQVGLAELLQLYDVQQAFGYSVAELVQLFTERHLRGSLGLLSTSGDEFAKGRPGRYLVGVLPETGEGGPAVTVSVGSDSHGTLFRLYLLDFTSGDRWWVFSSSLAGDSGVTRVTADGGRCSWVCPDPELTGGSVQRKTGHRYALVLELLGARDMVAAALPDVRLPFCGTLARAQEFSKRTSRGNPRLYGCRIPGARQFTPEAVFYEVHFTDGDKGFIEQVLLVEACSRLCGAQFPETEPVQLRTTWAAEAAAAGETGVAAAGKTEAADAGETGAAAVGKTEVR